MARGATSDWRTNLTSSAGTGAVPPSTGPVQDNPAAQTNNLLMTDNLKATMMPAQPTPLPGMPKPGPGVQMGGDKIPGVPPKPTSGAKFGGGF